jgi:hypothetical protein
LAERHVRIREKEESMSIGKTTAIPKKKWSERKKIVIASLVIAFFTIFALLVFIILTIGPGGTSPNTIQIVTNKGFTATTTTWIVEDISGDSHLPTSDVYVIVKNANGVVTIPTILLSEANGTYGFTYMPALHINPGMATYINKGDIFSLDKTLYTQGSSITLWQLGPNIPYSYCVLSV